MIVTKVDSLGVLSRKAYRIKQLNVLKNKVLAAQLVSGILKLGVGFDAKRLCC